MEDSSSTNFSVMSVTNTFFYKISEGIRITVRPSFLEDTSRRDQGQFVFLYAVRIENVSGSRARLVSRRWHIHDSIGEEMIVEGEGVVGEQPMLEPGGVHEYESYCVLKSANGYMQGQYFFEREDASRFGADIPRFVLNAE